MGRGLQRARAPGRAVELRAVLLGRGRGGAGPVAVHRRRPARGAEVLPRHPAGRRGAPRRLLQALHARGRRARRRDHGRRAAGDRAPADLRLPQDLRGARPPHGRAAPRPLADQARAVRDALPRDRRGDARAARPALHRGLPAAARAPPRLPRRDAQRRARRAAPHRLRRQAARRPARGGPGGARRGGRPAARGAPLQRGRAGAAGLGPLLHGVLRLHARADLRGGRPLLRDQAALGGDARRTSCPGRSRTRSTSPPDERARADGDAAAAAGSSARAPPRPRATRRRWPRCSTRCSAASTTAPRRTARSRCSGTSRTRSPGTCASTTAARRRGRASRPTPT